LFSSSGLRSVLRGFPPDEDDFWDGFDVVTMVAGEAAVVAVAVTVAVVDGADEVAKPADIKGATAGAGADENEMYLEKKRGRCRGFLGSQLGFEVVCYLGRLFPALVVTLTMAVLRCSPELVTRMIPVAGMDSGEEGGVRVCMEWP
jgi:hypothetical protein